ncbi:MAG: hypothetical protein HYU66_06450 [Armatimonadetes bacterium]|nr:hypothetical protein [Armatimonadota bacterium]
MSYWMRLYLGWIRTGEASDRAGWGADFVAPAAEAWPSVLDEFRNLVAEARAIAGDPALGDRRVRVEDANVPAATLLGDLGAHNAYHLGQIVLCRRLLGAWPPA